MRFTTSDSGLNYDVNSVTSSAFTVLLLIIISFPKFAFSTNNHPHPTQFGTTLSITYQDSLPASDAEDYRESHLNPPTPANQISPLKMEKDLIPANAATNYYTPGTGVIWDMDDVVSNSAGVVTGTFPNYTVNGDFYVRSTDTLTIPAGSIITLSGYFEFYTWGTIKAIGNTDLSITFTSQNKQPGDWRRIGVDNPSANNSEFSYVKIEYPEWGFLTWDTSGVIFSNSTITHASEGGVSAYRASPQILNNSIRNVSNTNDEYREYGISLKEKSSGVVSGNTIVDCESGIYVVDSSPEITGNTFSKTSENENRFIFGMFVTETSTPTISGNFIANCEEGIRVVNSTAHLTGNSFSDIDDGDDGTWEIGIQATEASQVTLTENQFTHVHTCIYGDATSTFNTSLNTFTTGHRGAIFHGPDNTVDGDSFKYFDDALIVASSSSSVIIKSEFNYNEYGVKIYDDSTVNLGNVENIEENDNGENTFLNNTWQIYNNTSKQIKAENNYWLYGNQSLAEERIYGPVDFIPGLGLMTPTLLSVVVDDDSNGNSLGNGNGIAEASETIELQVRFRFDNCLFYGGVSAKLSTESAYIQIENDFTRFEQGSCNSGGQSVTRVFLITISNDVPDQSLLNFNLNLAPEWQYSFDITVENNGDWQPPVMLHPHVSPVVPVGEQAYFTLKVTDGGSVATVKAEIEDLHGNLVATLPMYDDGNHDDYLTGDSYFGTKWTNPKAGPYLVSFRAIDASGNENYLENVVLFKDRGDQDIWVAGVTHKDGILRADYLSWPIENSAIANCERHRINSQQIYTKPEQIHNHHLNNHGRNYLVIEDSNIVSNRNVSVTLNLPDSNFKGLKSYQHENFQFLSGLTILGSSLWSIDQSTSTIHAHRFDEELSIYKSFQVSGRLLSNINNDGNNLWTIDHDTNAATIYSDDSSPSPTASFSLPHSNPSAFSWDGQNFWMGTWDDDTVYKLSNDGNFSVISSVTLPTIKHLDTEVPVTSIEFLNSFIWYSDSWSLNQLYRYSSPTSENHSTSSIYHKEMWVETIEWDGRYVWLADSFNDQIHKFIFPVPSGATPWANNFDNSTDTDQDGIVDWWENLNGLDRHNPDDASADFDNDGVTNLKEFLHICDPNNEDTDGDGMPDKWEIENDGEVGISDATVDIDGDGLTNFQEYQLANDPTFFLVETIIEGNGIITASGINCGIDCKQGYSSGSVIVLRATPEHDNSFVQWGGDCEKAEGTSCTLSVFSNAAISAKFTQNPIASIDDFPQEEITERYTFKPIPDSRYYNYIIATEDFNKDKIFDLASVHYGLNRDGKLALAISLGNGDGTFTTTSVFPINVYYGETVDGVDGDFNGDGIWDIVVGNNTYLGKGDGTFEVITDTISVHRIIDGKQVDFNEDGNDDILLFEYPHSYVYSYISNGDGTFTLAQKSRIPNISNTHLFAFQEAFCINKLFNNNRLATVYGQGSYFAELTFSSDGTFTFPSNEYVRTIKSFDSSYPSNAFIGGVKCDKDSWFDHVVFDAFGTSLWRLPIYYEKEYTIASINGFSSQSAVDFADFDNNGSNDLVIMEKRVGLSTTLNYNNWGLSSPTVKTPDSSYIGHNTFEHGADHISSKDFNNDGFRDIIIGGQYSLFFYPGRGDGTFGAGSKDKAFLPGEVIPLNASQSIDIDGNILSYSWNFGDGSTATGVAPEHSYAKPGVYKVQLTVEDNENAKNSISKKVLIRNPIPKHGILSFNQNEIQISESSSEVRVTLHRNGGSDGKISVNFKTTSAVATAGDDFEHSTGTLSFEPGEISKTITIPIFQDENCEEGTEDFFLDLSNATGLATIDQSTIVIQITDDLHDTDKDTIPDCIDNCPSTSNIDQADFDKDSYGDICDNDIDGDGVSNEQDCNDFNQYIHPGALDHPDDGIDQNCNDADTITCYLDSDKDGFGDKGAITILADDGTCDAERGESYSFDDCNDNDLIEHPGQIWYKDSDNDGYSDGTKIISCSRPKGFFIESELIMTDGDPDDLNPDVIFTFPWSLFLQNFMNDRF